MFAEPATVKDYVCLTMNPRLVFLEQIPFTSTESRAFVGYRESYTSYTDPGTAYAEEGAFIEEVPDESEVTMGQGVPLNTRPRLAGASFLMSDTGKPNFKLYEKKKYNQLVWSIAKNVESNLITALTSGASAPTTRYDASGHGVWSGNTADPLDDIRLMAEDVGYYEGYELKSIYVHRDNFYELYRNLETSDYDMTYARENTEKGNFYDMKITLKNPAIEIYGVRTGLGLSEGAFIGLGEFQSEPCVYNYAYSDPVFGSLETLGISDKGDVVPDLPLNVNTWNSPNNKEYHVEAWFDSVPFVEKPYGVLYKASGI